KYSLFRRCGSTGLSQGSRWRRPASLKRDIVPSLERKHLPRLVRRRNIKRQLVQDRADLGDLSGITLGELALAQVDAVLESNSAMSTHDRAHRHQSHLMPPGAENGPVIAVAEQMVRSAAHVHQVLGIGSDAAEDPENGLYQHRRLNEAAIDKMRQVVQ